MKSMSIRWRGRDAAIDEREFEQLVRAGLVPEDAWIVSPTYTRSHAIQARDLEVFHLWRPEDAPEPAPRPAVLGEIYLRRRFSVTIVLLFLQLLVAAVLAIAWRGAYPAALSGWARGAKLGVSGWFDLPALLAPTFLHASLQHLFGNCLYLFAFGAIVEYAFGPWRTLAIYLASGWAGSALSLALLGSSALSVGASGAIFGLIGATFVYLVRHQRAFEARLRWRARRIFVPMVLAVVAYSLFAGNVFAHGGGLAAGALAGLALDRGVSGRA